MDMFILKKIIKTGEIVIKSKAFNIQLYSTLSKVSQ